MFASLEFVHAAIARARFDDGLIGVTAIALRRRADTIFAAIVTALDAPLSASSVAALNRAFDRVELTQPATVRSELVAALRDTIGPSYSVSVLAIDDRTRLASIALDGHALWIRRDAALLRLATGTTSYRPGDMFLFTDALDAFEQETASTIPVVGTSRRAPAAAREFLAALVATAKPGAQAVRSVVAIHAGARDEVLARRRLVAAVAASVVIHFIVTDGLGWLPSAKPRAQARESTLATAIVTISSARRAAPTPVPRPPAPQPKVAVAQKPAAAAPPRPVTPQPQPHSRVQRVEAAIVPPHLKPQLPTAAVALAPRAQAPATRNQTSVHHYTAAELAALAQRLADASQAVQRTDPLAVPSSEPAAPKRYSLDMGGTPGRIRGHGILRPLQHWLDGGYIYYYVSYEIEFSDGTYESGDVPWPIRYLPKDDPFNEPPHTIPLPAPLPDYVLPPGTHLGRALRPYFPDNAD